jgi:branched-chain amino acid transport system ATP-binding protein
MNAVLEVRGVRKRFAGVTALDGVDLQVRRGEILAVLGPNGSGKTTLFNVISGFLKPSAGEVLFHGSCINGAPPYRLAGRGLVRTFQQAMSFQALTVRENVEVAIHATGRRKLADVADILDMCGLGASADKPASILPYGKQRNLGVAIALAAGPELLLLDEPAAGLGDEASSDLARLIRHINAQGVALMLIDHDMPFLLPLADRVVVLEAGRTLAEGTAESIVQNQKVIDVYFGHDNI